MKFYSGNLTQVKMLGGETGIWMGLGASGHAPVLCCLALRFQVVDQLSNLSNHKLGRFLNRILRHSRLSRAEIDALLSVRTTAVQYRPRIDVVAPGQTVDHACLVWRGIAGRFDQMRDGRRQISALHIPGDMCDLLSVVQPRASWSITALTQTTILQIPHTDLRDIAMRYPNIAMAFWRDTTLDSAVLNKWIGNLGRKDAQSRLAHLFCEMGLRFELAQLGTRTHYAFGLTQEQLADAAGLTSVHVNRTLQRLRETGAISVQTSFVEIHDWCQLSRIAQFEPEYLWPTTSGSEQRRFLPNSMAISA